MIDLSNSQAMVKRTFDILVSVVGLTLSWWAVALTWLVVAIETKSNGFFIQQRIGRYGRPISIVKIKTMRTIPGVSTSVTSGDDPRILTTGRFLRKYKLDELPQLWNVLIGDMSLVGPRPDVPGFADELCGIDRSLLNVRPGITGPASIKYKNEEVLLSRQADPETYNREVIWPDKVRINVNYIRNWSLFKDVRYIMQTILGN